MVKDLSQSCGDSLQFEQQQMQLQIIYWTNENYSFSTQLWNQKEFFAERHKFNFSKKICSEKKNWSWTSHCFFFLFYHAFQWKIFCLKEMSFMSMLSLQYFVGAKKIKLRFWLGLSNSTFLTFRFISNVQNFVNNSITFSFYSVSFIKTENKMNKGTEKCSFTFYRTNEFNLKTFFFI